jgi:hypothetical protein
VALLQHLERVEQLLAEEILALAVIGLRGEYRDRVLRQPVAAERGLAAPDGKDITRRAVFLLDPPGRRAVVGELLRLRREV